MRKMEKLNPPIPKKSIIYGWGESRWKATPKLGGGGERGAGDLLGPATGASRVSIEAVHPRRRVLPSKGVMGAKVWRQIESKIVSSLIEESTNLLHPHPMKINFTYLIREHEK